MKLEHASAYLPYKLQMAFIVREVIVKVGTLNNISINNSDTHPIRYSIDTLNELEHEWMFKPILRPISDLTKEIEHNGEKFVPIRKLEDLFPCVEFYNDDELSYLFSDTSCNGDTYHSIELSLTLEISSKLFEWHFDVFNLHEKGLAIDINTLNNEKTNNIL